MKARYVLLVLALNYVLLLFVSGVAELNIDNSVAQKIFVDMSTAGDMALQQTQTIDEYINNPLGTPDYLIMPSSDGSGFVPIDVFKGLFGLNTSTTLGQKKLMRTLYGGKDFNNLASSTSDITIPVQYANPTTGIFSWYYIPKIVEMGLNNFNTTTKLALESDVKSVLPQGGTSSVSSDTALNIFKAYNLTQTQGSINGSTYYNTPLSLGISYINPNFLRYLFENNMDLLMRSKYTSNLNTPEGGSGVYEGLTSTYAISGSSSRSALSNISSQNPINNGEFTYLRGTPNQSADSSVQSFSGVKPRITYKVIDMYSKANDSLLVDLFGANIGSSIDKASYLKSLDSRVINPATDNPYSHKYIVVAKVTFYADVIVPYSTWIIRDLRALDTGINYVNIKSKSGSNIIRLQYTRLFAVTP